MSSVNYFTSFTANSISRRRKIQKIWDLLRHLAFHASVINYSLFGRNIYFYFIILSLHFAKTLLLKHHWYDAGDYEKCLYLYIIIILQKLKNIRLRDFFNISKSDRHNSANCSDFTLIFNTSRTHLTYLTFLLLFSYL